ncbi:phage terminase large subunit-like protein [Rhizobium mesoamericanum]|nr:phage terminase large subunit-like protein [Rhizobium mesoamericanum]
MLANAANPAPGLVDALAQQSGGAPLGRQELDGI